MNSLGAWVALALGALLAVFAIQNMASVQVSFLGFEFQTRRFILIGMSVLIGFLLGKAIRFRKRPDAGPPEEEG